MNSSKLGHIYTYYSYKGGTGRSMALANSAWLLASSGYDVAMLDWDLEAPGLHRYFAPFLIDPQLASSDGIIDCVVNYAAAAVRPSEQGNGSDNTTPSTDWYKEYARLADYAISIEWDFPEVEGRQGSLSLIPSGRQGGSYSAKVNSFNWQNLYDRLGGHPFFEAVKDNLRQEFDFILIDSRTGVSDTAGICTVQLPESMVVFFTLNNQSIEGSAGVARSILTQRKDSGFRVFPVATRIDNSEKDKLTARWQLAKQRYEGIPAGLSERESASYWDEVALPYVPNFAFEEVLAAFANQPDDPLALNLQPRVEALVRHLTGIEACSGVISPESRRLVLDAYAGREVLMTPAQKQRAEAEAQALAIAEAASAREREAASARDIEQRTRQTVEEEYAATLKKLQEGRARRVKMASIALLLVILGAFTYNRYLANTEAQRQTLVTNTLEIASSYIKQGSYREADALLVKLLVTAPDSAEAYALLAKTKLGQQNPAAAWQAINTAVSISMAPDKTELWSQRADIASQTHHFDVAVEDLTKLSAARPQETGILLRLADAQQQTGQQSAAVQTLGQALQLEPDNVKALVQRGQQTIDSSPKDAIKDFQKVIELSPASTEATFAQAKLTALGVASPTTPINAVPKQVVFIQYASKNDDALVESLRIALANDGVKVPAAQMIGPRSSGDVRYFYPEDLPTAAKVKTDTEQLLARNGYLQTLKLLQINPRDLPKNTDAATLRGQIEVWLPVLASPSTAGGDYRKYAVDVFYCGGEQSPNRQLADSAAAQADSPNRWRVRPLPDATNAQPGYGIKSDLVRFNPSEREAGEQLRLRVQQTLGQDIAAQEIAYDTPNYLSVFICKERGLRQANTPAVNTKQVTRFLPLEKTPVMTEQEAALMKKMPNTQKN
ncbi:KGGVGR-motif variant AAA ATPase [Chitinimonas naiadis]